jgi:hypothetical protein
MKNYKLDNPNSNTNKKVKALIYSKVLGIIGCSAIIIGTYLYN